MLTATYDYAACAKEDVPACPVCGTANPSYPAYDRLQLPIGVSVCRCGLGYLNPRLTRAEYATFYRDWYRPLLAPHIPVDPDRDRMDAQTWGRAIATLVRRDCHPQGDALLDVGGSTGDMAAAVCDVIPHTSVTVLDPNPHELAQAAAKGYQTQIGVVDEQPPSAARYSGILCARTIDHVRDPLAALRWLRSVLAPGGWLAIDMVDAAAWRRDRPLAAWRVDHPLYWSVPSLRRALQMTGWRPMQMWTLPHPETHRGFICEGV